MSDLLKVENLTVRFEVKRGGGWNKKSYLYAVDDVSFTVNACPISKAIPA